MLSRTADHLYWMSRYTERAENTARMLDVNYQMSLLPQSAEVAEQAWRSLLEISELTAAFDASYVLMSPRDVIHFMVSDMNNPSSIMRCLQAARENARAVRGSMTTELWETINTTWLEAQKKMRDGMLDSAPSEFFEWVKFRSHQTRGVQHGTMVRDEVFHFIRLGTFLERADNTARLLDVKSLTAENMREQGHDSVDDFYYWAAILRSVSAFEIYRKVYRDVITPERVADLLILRSDMPRSLSACVGEVVDLLVKIKNSQSSKTITQARNLLAQLRDAHIGEILDQGLHAFLTDFLLRINTVGSGISRDFLLPMEEMAA
ncbi:MAG: alpha-E domain-containing protein [Polynucleobacter victoriensis]